jgi:hypothetical protein
MNLGTVESESALVLYRKAVVGTFAEDDPHVLGLPDVNTAPGSTPAAVIASISWDPITGKAKITWSASAEADLREYEIRYCPGPNYLTETEVVVGNVFPTDPLEFLTDSGLAASGNTASFKVYVILSTNNEKGSNTVTITRP